MAESLAKIDARLDELRALLRAARAAQDSREAERLLIRIDANLDRRAELGGPR